MRRYSAAAVAALDSFAVISSASGQVFSSSGSIAIPSAGPANPYPSVINFAGGPTSISGVGTK